MRHPYVAEIKINSLLLHPNVCPFYGEERKEGTGLSIVIIFILCISNPGIVILNDESVGMVSRFIPHGPLSAFLYSHRDDMVEAQRLDLLIDIAKGLQYLHQSRIIHRDLKTDNVLLDEDFVGRICVTILTQAPLSNLYSYAAVLTDFGCSGVRKEETKWLQTVS